MGYMVKRMPMTSAKTAIMSQSSKKMISRKRVRTRLFTTSAARSPMERPSFRSEMTRAPKSCTPPKKMDPKKTQSTAGTQPQITAMAGPTMGPSPAMEVKWWPKRISFRVGM